MALPEGIESDRRLEEVRQGVKSLHDISDKLGDKLQVPRAKNYLQQLVDCISPNRNPAGYRLCQEELSRVGGPGVLLHAAGQTDNDLLRSLVLETFAHMTFDNAGLAASVLGEHGDGLLRALRTSLADGSVPERLSALLLAQALAVAEAPPAVLEVLASEAERFLDLKDGSHGFAQLGEAALDVLASVSFAHPTAAIENLGWSKMAALLEERDSPPESGTEQLQVLVCGLLAANCLAAGDGSAAEEVHNRLASGSFFRLYAQCLAASVAREAWPQDSNTYHSPRRLARAASRLATLGFRRELLPAMTLLPRIVEGFGDGAPVEALKALKSLAADAECLEALLMEETFRETLDGLHRDLPEARELLSYMELVESAMAAGQSAKAAQAHENPMAPSVMQLTDIFGNFSPLDGRMDLVHLASICAAVPLAPAEAVRRSLQSETSLTLQSFLEHVYGTPTILGWWPSLMEELASLAASTVGAGGPGLGQLVASFEAASGGRSGLPIQELHDVLLPSIGIETDGAVIEAKFAELHGSAPLSFKDFMRWIADLFVRLEAEAAVSPPAPPA